MSLASVAHSSGASPVSRARVQIPAWGRWWADVDLVEVLDMSAGDAVTIAFADVDLVGAVVSGGAAYGRSSYRVVGGTDGWSSTVSAQGYRDDSGVSAAKVIADAALACGETIEAPPVTRGGVHFTRRAAPAIDVLNVLVPRAWYVDRDGVTRFGERTESVYTGSDPRVARHPSSTAIDLETSDVSPFIPGVNVDGIGTAVDVEYRLDSARLTVRVQAGPRSTRELDAFRRVVEALDPLRAYRACYEYRVVTQDGNALNLQPVRASAGMPDLARVPVRLAPGQSAEHKLGSLVVVSFVDGDPSRPIVIAGDDPDSPGWAPTDAVLDASTSVTVGASAPQTKLGAAPQLGVARIGDAVQAGPYVGVITGGSSTVLAGG